MITWEELVEEINKLLPRASFGNDNEGQIIIYTNLTNDDNYNLVDMDAGAYHPNVYCEGEGICNYCGGVMSYGLNFASEESKDEAP